MDMWMKIGSAVLIGAMLMFLLPRAKAMVQNSPKADGQQWLSALIPLALVVGFVVLLVMMV